MFIDHADIGAGQGSHGKIFSTAQPDDDESLSLSKELTSCEEPGTGSLGTEEWVFSLLFNDDVGRVAISVRHLAFAAFARPLWYRFEPDRCPDNEEQ